MPLPFEPSTPPAPIADVEYFTPRAVPAFQVEFGARYWFGTGKTSKNLYGPPALYNGLVSRLTYNNFLVNAGEFDWRVAFTNGWFIKGYIGGGAATQGQLQDEDFPPGITPYSSTTSREANGFLGYGSVDVGYDILRGGDFASAPSSATTTSPRARALMAARRTRPIRTFASRRSRQPSKRSPRTTRSSRCASASMARCCSAIASRCGVRAPTCLM
jgi:hypothetical protein